MATNEVNIRTPDISEVGPVESSTDRHKLTVAWRWQQHPHAGARLLDHETVEIGTRQSDPDQAGAHPLGPGDGHREEWRRLPPPRHIAHSAPMSLWPVVRHIPAPTRHKGGFMGGKHDGTVGTR